MKNQRAQMLILLVIGAIALPPLLSRAVPEVFTSRFMLTLAVGVSVAASALSLNILMGYTGQISLGHAAFLGIGAFASGQLTAQGPEWPLAVGLVAAATAGGIFALAIGIPALRLRGLYLAIATIAFAFMMEESFFRWQPLTGGSAGLELPRRLLPGLDLKENGDYLAFSLVILLIAIFIDRNITRTKLGRAFQAIRFDEDVAQSFGVDVTRFKLISFVTAGALAGVAGAMFGHLIGFVSASMFDFDFSLLLVIIVVVGGLGSRNGVIVAGFFFAILPRLLDFLAGWDLIVGPILLIDVLARNPGGLAQAFKDARERRAAKKAKDDVSSEPEEETLPALTLPRDVQPIPTDIQGNVLEVRGVSVAFGGLQAVSDVSLDVPSNQIVGLIGPNGAGKTTLFNAISGFVETQAGRVNFLGQDIHALPPFARIGRGIGRTFQLIGLARDLSVTENLLLAQHLKADYNSALALLRTPKVKEMEETLRERARFAIESLGFERFTDTPVKNLSHGQQRIVELGCALVNAPELLLLDEPSAGMAPAMVENLAVRMKDLRDELGRTVLLIEHNIPLVLDVCDYIYVLNFGQVLVHGTTDEIASHPEAIAAYFGEAVGETVTT
jgi:branched-chain amino acid transport system permease protein